MHHRHWRSLALAVLVAGVPIAARPFAVHSPPGVAHEAASRLPPPARLCAQEVDVWRRAYAEGAMSGTPWEQGLMLDSLDGNTAGALTSLDKNPQQLDGSSLRRWRSSVLALSVYSGDEALAKAMIVRGVDVDAEARLPDFAGAMQQVASPLMLAVACDHVSMARLLLDHGASLYLAPPAFPARRGYDVLMAMVYREAPMLFLFLERGLDPCRVVVKPDHPLATIARHVKLPADLVARLTCTRQAAPS